MSKKLCFVFNLLMSLFTTFIFLIKNQDIILYQFVIKGGEDYLDRYMDEFVLFLDISLLVLGILSMALAIYSGLVSKQIDKIKSSIIDICIICLVANFIGFLFMKSFTILCFLHILCSILLFVPFRTKLKKE